MKLIHVYRDPRDVLASYQTKSWGGGDLLAVANRISNVYTRWFEVRDLLPKEAYLELSLEELSAKPEEQIKEISEFIDMPFNQKMLSLDLNKTNAGRWKNDLEEGLQGDCLSVLGDAIKQYGY